MSYKLSVIGVGNMARAVVLGIQNSDVDVSEICLFDKNDSQYSLLPDGDTPYTYSHSISEAIKCSDCVLLSVKPQNYDEVLSEIATVDGHQEKLYISIAAGISVKNISNALSGASVVRILPNIPMIIGMGVSVVCKNEAVSPLDFEFVCSLFRSSGSILLIDETEMNRVISVT